MTLAELRNRLIETCRGKKEFIEALELMVSNGIGIGEDDYSDIIICDEWCWSAIIGCAGVTCGHSYCPFYEYPNCSNEIEPNKDMMYDEFKAWWDETLTLAIASCNGDEVKEEVPVDQPEKPMFVVKGVDDLVGLVSEDGKFRVAKSTTSMGVMYEVFGARTQSIYYQFDKLEDKTIAVLDELGFRFTIQKRKSYIEMLDECEGVEFEYQKPNFAVYKNKSEEVDKFTFLDMFFPGVKYISKEDAERIVKECAENNG